MSDRVSAQFTQPSLGRREFIAGAGAMAATALAGPLASPSRVQATALAKKLVVVLASGGWDTTYALDPKLGVAGIDSADGELRRFGELSVLTHAARPAVAEFFERYAGLCAVVNGVQVRSFVHTDCLKRMLTGSPSETTPDLCAAAAFELGRELPVPYLALGAQARSGPYAAITGRTGTTNQLAALVDPSAAYPAPGQLVPEVGFSPNPAEEQLVRKYLDATSARLLATRGQRGYNRARVEDFRTSLDRAERLRAFAKASGFGKRDYTLELSVQIPLTVRALSQGLSCAALMQTDDWDTHQDNARQGMLHQGLFASLRALVEALQGAALLDDTLVVVLSEMGRTPRLNADRGKDHWPVTSALLLGAGVRGGRVLGASSGQLEALSIDLATGAPSASGKQLQAPNLIAGILETLGIAPASYLPGVEPFRAFMA